MIKCTTTSLSLQKGCPNMLRPSVSYKHHWHCRVLNVQRVFLSLFGKHISYPFHRCWSLINILNTKFLLRVCFLESSTCDVLEQDWNGVLLSLLCKRKLFLISHTEENRKEGIFIPGAKRSVDLLQERYLTWNHSYARYHHVIELTTICCHSPYLPCLCPS